MASQHAPELLWNGLRVSLTCLNPELILKCLCFQVEICKRNPGLGWITSTRRQSDQEWETI